MAEVEEFLEHYGVKGMKWGQRKTREQRQAARVQKIKAKGQKKLAREKAVNSGQEYFRSGKARENLIRGKGKAREAKAAKGKRAAKKIMAQTKLKNATEYEKATRARNGAEFIALSVLSGGGYNAARAGTKYQVRRQAKRVQKFS